MRGDLRDERLREWIVCRHREGYTVERMREALRDSGYDAETIDSALGGVLGVVNDDAEVHSARFAEFVGRVFAELRSYDFKVHFQKIEYVLTHPGNFVDEIRDLDGSVFAKDAAYVFLNVCLFSFFRSAVNYVFGGPFWYFFVDIVYLVLFSLVLLFVFGFVVHKVLCSLQGRGRFADTMRVIAYASSVIVFAPLPYIWVIPALYGIVLAVFNLSLVHKVGKKSAGIAVGVPALIVAVFALIISVLIGLQG